MSYLRSLLGIGPHPAEVARIKAIPPPIVPVEAKLVTVKPMSGAPDVRHFSVPEINKYIEDNLSILEPGKRDALLVYGDMVNGKLRGNAVYAGRLNRPVLGGKFEWTVFVNKEWGGDLQAGAGAKWSR